MALSCDVQLLNRYVYYGTRTALPPHLHGASLLVGNTVWHAFEATNCTVSAGFVDYQKLLLAE